MTQWRSLSLWFLSLVLAFGCGWFYFVWAAPGYRSTGAFLNFNFLIELQHVGEAILLVCLIALAGVAIACAAARSAQIAKRQGYTMPWSILIVFVMLNSIAAWGGAFVASERYPPETRNLEAPTWLEPRVTALEQQWREQPEQIPWASRLTQTASPRRLQLKFDNSAIKGAYGFQPREGGWTVRISASYPEQISVNALLMFTDANQYQIRRSTIRYYAPQHQPEWSIADLHALRLAWQAAPKVAPWHWLLKPSAQLKRISLELVPPSPPTFAKKPGTARSLVGRANYTDGTRIRAQLSYSSETMKAIEEARRR